MINLSEDLFNERTNNLSQRLEEIKENQKSLKKVIYETHEKVLLQDTFLTNQSEIMLKMQEQTATLERKTAAHSRYFQMVSGAAFFVGTLFGVLKIII